MSLDIPHDFTSGQAAIVKQLDTAIVSLEHYAPHPTGPSGSEPGLPEDVEPERIEILRELAYLLSDTTDPDAFSQAQRSLVSDAIRLQEFRAPMGVSRDTDPRDVPEVSLEVLFDTLADMLSLDTTAAQSRQYRRRPALGELSLWSRVVKSRLRRVGLLESYIFMPWQKSDNVALRTLALRLVGQIARKQIPRRGETGREVLPEWHPADDDVWVSISGNARKMLDLMLSSRRWHDRYFVGGVHSAKPPPQVRNHGYISIAPDEGISSGIFKWDPRANWWDDEARRRYFKFSDVTKAVDDPCNALGLRLLRIRLWQLGYHWEKQIDLSDSNDLYDSIERMRQSMNARKNVGPSEFSRGKIFKILQENRGYMAINPHFIEKRMIRVIEAEAEAGKPGTQAVGAEKAYEEHALSVYGDVNADESARRALLDEATREFQNIREHQRNTVVAVRGFRTVTRMARMALFAVRNVLVKVGKTLSNFLVPVRNLFLSTVGSLFRLARQLRLAARQITHFVLGKPFGWPVELPDGTTQRDLERMGIAWSRFQLDRDAVAFSHGPPAERRRAQQALGSHIRLMSLGLALGLSFALLVIQALPKLVVPPIGFIAILGLAYRLLWTIREASTLAAAAQKLPG